MVKAQKNLPEPGRFVPPQQAKTIGAGLLFLGVLALAIGMYRDAGRVWHAYLIGLFYFTSIALGGLFFAAIQHVTRAGWSVNVRRFAEALTSFLPYAFGAGVLFFVFGAPKIYSWFDHAVVAQDHLIQHKAAYLNPTFFGVRLLLFFGLWWLFSRLIVGRSLAQDKTGDEQITHRLVGTGVKFLLVFALTYSFFSIDTLMSLDPHWFSTIFGVYAFAGLFQSTLAAMILIILFLRQKGLITSYVNENHLHDLGKFLFAFTVFWAYIAFSQYMLIWYANMPEETTFYLPRSQGSWAIVSVALIVFKFIVPFLALLPRWAKRTPSHLAAVCILLLVMQYVDLYWLVYPSFNPERVVFSGYELFVFLGFLGGFLLVIMNFLSQNSLIPVRDPRIHESVGHHVVY